MSEQEIVDEEVEVTTDEVEETEDVDTDTDGGDDYDDLSHEEAITRLKKAEGLIVKHKKAPKQEEPIKNESSDTRLDRMELKQDGYPEEIVNSIMELGGKEALKNPILKKTVDDMLVQHNAERASGVSGGSTSSLSTKYSKEDLENMSVEQLEKILPHA